MTLSDRARPAGVDRSPGEMGWPCEWTTDELSPEERVRTFLRVIADGVTAEPGDILGLSQEVIREIEDDQPAPLPDTYRWFLTLAGGGAGRFLQGSDVFYPQVMGLWTAARELLRENESEFVLGKTDRVILMHQGHQFDFLRGTGPNPEVWSYREINNPGNAPKPSHACFSDWLRANAEEQTKAWARLLPWCEKVR